MVVMSGTIQEHPGVPTKQISFRVPLELWERAEKQVELLNEQPEYRAFRVTATKVLMQAMHEGMDVIEARTEGEGDQ